MEENEKMEHQFFAKDKLRFNTFDTLEVAISPAVIKTDVVTGVEIKPFHTLDNKVPDRFLFGVLNANHYNGSLITGKSNQFPFWELWGNSQHNIPKLGSCLGIAYPDLGF